MFYVMNLRTNQVRQVSRGEALIYAQDALIVDYSVFRAGGSGLPLMWWEV